MSDWLSWIASVHTAEIELGLDRIKAVAAKLDVLAPTCPVITIAGTNGKGSTVAGLEAIYLAAGYQVGAFTSPYLFKYNEEVRINGQAASDAAFCQAFAKVEAARGDIPLTQFEFGTLAALVMFKAEALDVILLEVGLGGRLDGVNIIDADVAVITSIGIDHVDWLGDTREKIAIEKAGVMRAGKPAVCGDMDPPVTLLEYAKNLGSKLYCQSVDFQYEENPATWSWSTSAASHSYYTNLPLNHLSNQNMSCVLMAVTLLNDRLPVSREAIDKGLACVTLPGRIQVLNGTIMEIYDVSHNPAAIAFLAKRLKAIACFGKTLAVFSMLSDKDVLGSINAIKEDIDGWCVAPLPIKRAASMDMLKQAFTEAGVNEVSTFSSVEEAYNIALIKSQLGDRVVVFGSFHTVAEAWLARQKRLQEFPM